MSAIQKCQTQYLMQIINANNEAQAHIYLEQILLFPIDTQDKIIDEISRLPQCNSNSVAAIIGRYSRGGLKE
ncbi:hypothetical protein GCM10009111_30110 [Colwellia asteriadis]|uniref:Uncharacterized protein n=1 Tax=Colwellia asteriadis TaxID=517723 RepID=A0ABN1LA39_9GAMM